MHNAPCFGTICILMTSILISMGNERGDWYPHIPAANAWTFSVVPATPNPNNKFNQRLMDHVLPNELIVQDGTLLEGGGRIAFTNSPASPPFSSAWTQALSPTSIKSLRLVVSQIQNIKSPSFTQEEVLHALQIGLPKTLPWEVYGAFGNRAVPSSKESLLKVSCRRWASCNIPKSQLSTTYLTNGLRKVIVEKWGSDPRARDTDCEFTLVLFEDQCWLEWTLLVPPSSAATMDLPRPGCKRVEAWMLVQSCRELLLAATTNTTTSAEPPSICIMDPLCGKGTYLVEAATTLPYSQSLNLSFVGVDLSDEQLADAQVNAERTGCQDQIQLRKADSRSMTWQPDRSVDAIVTCPPFGIQFGQKDDLPTLYKDWLKEWNRVLRRSPKGQIALVVNVGNEDLALEAIRETGDLVVKIHREPFRLGRLQATVIVAEPKDEQTPVAAAPLSRFPWESNAKESRAEWTRLRAAALQELVPYTQTTKRSESQDPSSQK